MAGRDFPSYESSPREGSQHSRGIYAALSGRHSGQPPRGAAVASTSGLYICTYVYMCASLHNLQVVLYNEGALESIVDDLMLELCDWCHKQVVALASWRDDARSTANFVEGKVHDRGRHTLMSSGIMLCSMWTFSGACNLKPVKYFIQRASMQGEAPTWKPKKERSALG